MPSSYRTPVEVTLCLTVQVHFGTQLGKMYLNADMYGMNCVTGMSCLFRKEILDDCGGLRGLAQFLAEDYYLGQKCLERCDFIILKAISLFFTHALYCTVHVLNDWILT